MTATLRVVLVGEDSAGIQALRTIAHAGHDVVAVMASPHRRAAAGSTLWNVAQRMGYATWPSVGVKDPACAERLRAESVDLLLNVHSLFVMHPRVVMAPRIGSFNLHPSPLPRYAGLNSVSWAIYAGEESHGVTLHRMEAGIDTGSIAWQTRVPIEAHDTALTVSLRCVKAGIPMIEALLHHAAEDPAGIPSVPQNLSARSYYGGGMPEGGRLSWAEPARRLVNLIRACDYAPYPSPWGALKGRIGDRTIHLFKAYPTGCATTAPPGTVGLDVGAGVAVACADEWMVLRHVGLDGRTREAADALRQGDRLDSSLLLGPTTWGPLGQAEPGAVQPESAAAVLPSSS